VQRITCAAALHVFDDDENDDDQYDDDDDYMIINIYSSFSY